MIRKAITRNIIPNSFQLYNSVNSTGESVFLHRDQLIDFIDFWKAIFVEKFNLTKGHNIGLGFPLTDIYYFSALIASCELGLRLVVLDIFSHNLQADHKIKDFLPLDLFIAGPNLSTERQQYYKKVSRQFTESNIWDNYTVVDSKTWHHCEKFPDSCDELLLCTSSGTTNTPKKIKHTHEFLYEISSRNKNLLRFDGNVLHLRNLHHGSSLAVYFLPALMSEYATAHYVFNFEDHTQIKDLIDFTIQHNINHIHFPYTESLEKFLLLANQLTVEFNDLTLYTLSYINPEWQPLIENTGVKKIISIFGSNETSGPVLLNTLSKDQINFSFNEFYQFDNFYQITVNEEHQLKVTVPVYNMSVVMQDIFEIHGNKFIHKGRSDLIRINDITIELFYILDLCKKYQIDGQCVVDQQYEKIYLALWSPNDRATDIINQDLKNYYGKNIHIAESRLLNKDNFMFGIKIDHELIRERFRYEK